MSWYEDLPSQDQTLARLNPGGLAVVHTSPYPEQSRWRLFPYMRHIVQRVTHALLHGGNVMVFMPPRHGKSFFCSAYVPAWFEMMNPTKNTILTSYSAELSADFSKRSRNIVREMGHLFGVRINPNQDKANHWQVQHLSTDGDWVSTPAGGEVYSAGVDGPLPGRGAHLIVLDDVVKGGNADTSPQMMEKAYNWYRGVLETRQEPGCVKLLVMTRWAMADIAGRLLEDEADEWDVIVLPALAKHNDPVGRKVGEALCPERFSREWLERKRDSSDEGGMIFAALYQQEPMPEDGAIFKAEQILKWEGRGEAIRFGPHVLPFADLKLHFATIDPALKDKEVNDPTGFMVWAVAQAGPNPFLILLEDHTKRMQGSLDLLPKMHQVRQDYPGIRFHVESKAHGTEIIRACQREGLPVVELDADRDKVTRAIGAQPAFAAGRVYIPKDADAVVRELLEFPGGRHDDRVDCVAYAVQVWRDLVRALKFPRRRVTEEKRDGPDVHPADRPDRQDKLKDRRGRWLA